MNFSVCIVLFFGKYDLHLFDYSTWFVSGFNLLSHSGGVFLGTLSVCQGIPTLYKGGSASVQKCTFVIVPKMCLEWIYFLFTLRFG